ncbi:MAG: GGDEF domain-containing protein [Fuerstiella sp.]|nr:GGDEF domain-containing protein [Fuerstiella sp.]MCP4508885.1 GGDEF domain-containing protein [Fuerstiella sp.]
MSDALRAKAAVIQVSSQECDDAPLVVHKETLLGDLNRNFGSHYILVADDDQRIVGVAQRSEILRRLNSANPFERRRWQAVPIETMSNLSFSNDRLRGPLISEDTLECSTIREGDRLFGLAVEGDLFLSWGRLESLFNAALSDSLTGVMNRFAYERRLAEEWNRAARTHTSVGIVLVDLDNFKEINDTYGHTIGDEVLTRVAQILEQSIRSSDVVARYGGDEFVALCLGCAPGDIQIPVSRLSNGLKQIVVNVDGEKVDVSASIGAAVRHGNFLDSQSSHLFAAADDCLYRAKKSSHRAWGIEFETGCETTRAPVAETARDLLSVPSPQHLKS